MVGENAQLKVGKLLGMCFAMRFGGGGGGGGGGLE